MDPEILKSSHDKAEKARRLYEVGHRVLNAAAVHHLDDPLRLAAFSHGITTYEALSYEVRPKTHPETETDIALCIIGLESRFSINELMSAQERFKAEMPLTAHIIEESAARIYSDEVDYYAIAGAAISRQLEVDARS